jgi:hypothetical protein
MQIKHVKELDVGTKVNTPTGVVITVSGLSIRNLHCAQVPVVYVEYWFLNSKGRKVYEVLLLKDFLGLTDIDPKKK